MTIIEPKLRWYQSRLRVLLLLMVPISLGGAWLAVRWHRQYQRHLVKIIIGRRGLSAVAADDQLALPYFEAARSLPLEKLVAISSKGQTEIFIEECGTDPERFLKLVHALEIGALPSKATVQEVELLKPGTDIPQVVCRTVETLQIEVAPQRCKRFGVSVAAVEKAVSEKGELPATAENVRSLASTTIQVSGSAGRQTILLGDLARITVRKEPSHIVRQQ
jgi:hypothetical protein